MELQDVRIKVVQVPGDGNCLFYAVVQQLSGRKIFDSEFYEEAMNLRRATAAYLRDHKAEMKEVILSEIIDITNEPTDNMENWQVDAKIDQHLINLQKSGTWAGAEALLAMKEMLGVNIRVYNPHYQPLELTYGNGEGRTIEVYYNGVNHYDSVEQGVMEGNKELLNEQRKVIEQRGMTQPENVGKNQVIVEQEQEKKETETRNETNIEQTGLGNDSPLRKERANTNEIMDNQEGSIHIRSEINKQDQGKDTARIIEEQSRKDKEYVEMENIEQPDNKLMSQTMNEHEQERSTEERRTCTEVGNQLKEKEKESTKNNKLIEGSGNNEARLQFEVMRTGANRGQ
ncbi:OTU domain-containing protein 3-like [Aedes albopictus]|uniref:OTU domain-containing protein n=1 Tax=Aedes albopictus TaxID=7160 RepID=A0ABM1XKE8_AEDAL|nr:OTU domain-containing protein 3-like [Aedes albopictus]